MSQEKSISIIGYLDYRDYLKAAYEHLKATTPQFSFRYLAKKAKLTAPSTIKMVMEGERNLSPKMAEHFILGLGLKGYDAEYFRLLVRYNQAKNDAQRNRLLADLRRIMERRKVNAIPLAQYDYLSHWFVPIVREMVPCRGFQPSPAKIARFLFDQISADEARYAVDLLHRLGLVGAESGRLVQTTPHIKTSDDILHLAVKNYHRQMLAQASRSIERQPSEKRDLQALTMAIDPEKVPEAKRRILAFIDEMRGFLQSANPKQVYQLGIQFFGVTDEEFPE